VIPKILEPKIELFDYVKGEEEKMIEITPSEIVIKNFITPEFMKYASSWKGKLHMFWLTLWFKTCIFLFHRYPIWRG
jgi:hypothetical protein